MGAKLCCFGDNENNAKDLIAECSNVCFKFYDKIAKENFNMTDCRNFRDVFLKLKVVKMYGKELVEVSRKVNSFNPRGVRDIHSKKALKYYKRVGGLFALSDDYFSQVLANISVLRELSNFKNIEPYGTEESSRPREAITLAFYPDLERIIRASTDNEEIKFYWITWRERNLLWASLGFFTIVESIKKSATFANIPVLEYWYHSHDSEKLIHDMELVMSEIRPLYVQLHGFIRLELYKKYGAGIIDLHGPIPIHLYHQVIIQAWQKDSIIEKYYKFEDLLSYEQLVTQYDAMELITIAEEFFHSLGFKPLEKDFARNRLKVHEDENIYNCQIELYDVTPKTYMKYCKTVDFAKYLQYHHNLCRIYYAKEKANLPMHFFNSYDLEYSVGHAVILSVCTPKHLKTMIDENIEISDDKLMNRLLHMSIDTLCNLHIYFVNTKVMHDLLSGNIEICEVNKHFWDLMDIYVGVAPPIEREQNAIDFTYKFYLDLEQNRQLKKFLGVVLGYQFYKAFYEISDRTEPLQNYDFFNNEQIGENIREMMSLGSSMSFYDVIGVILTKNKNLSADGLMDYYAPMLAWVQRRNKAEKVRAGWNSSNIKVN
ncbi:angiotensin-converting enzyme-like [Teleopsis dalmanni]|uniref:angiotensin-converting enzyme-like n=1 Tax=Teleopsis dalmanni TaxID=139649 RepID=UPI0018CEE943|nr:angiotensin-converting enzyme-like [Teleopsis dalmanni]